MFILLLDAWYFIPVKLNIIQKLKIQFLGVRFPGQKVVEHVKRGVRRLHTKKISFLQAGIEQRIIVEITTKSTKRHGATPPTRRYAGRNARSEDADLPPKRSGHAEQLNNRRQHLL